MTARRFVLALLAGVALLLSACGDDSPQMPADPASSPAGQLLPPVAAYVDAVNGKNLDGLVNAFAPDGEVVDVGRRFAGRDEIRGWAEREVIGGTLTVTGIADERPGYQRLLVRFAPGGNGGFAAHYAFTIDGGAITKADLTYAN